MNKTALFKIGYGLYILSSKDENGKDVGCVINTASQVTDTPLRVTVTVNKNNYTCQSIAKTGVFTVSMLDTTAPFDMFKSFGFRSSKDCDKFSGVEVKRDENGVVYVTEHTNSFLSCKVYDSVDLGTHILFIADVLDADVFNDEVSITYNFYQQVTKPAPVKTENKKGYRCTICGYFHEGEISDDFICPICKHGRDAFKAE